MLSPDGQLAVTTVMSGHDSNFRIRLVQLPRPGRQGPINWLDVRLPSRRGVYELIDFVDKNTIGVLHQEHENEQPRVNFFKISIPLRLDRLEKTLICPQQVSRLIGNSCIIMKPKGKILAMLHHPNAVSFWDIDRNVYVSRRFGVVRNHQRQFFSIGALCTPDNNYLIVYGGSFGQRVVIFDLSNIDDDLNNIPTKHKTITIDVDGFSVCSVLKPPMITSRVLLKLLRPEIPETLFILIDCAEGRVITPDPLPWGDDIWKAFMSTPRSNEVVRNNNNDNRIARDD